MAATFIIQCFINRKQDKELILRSVDHLDWLFLHTDPAMRTKEAGMHLQQGLMWLGESGLIIRHMRGFCKAAMPKSIWCPF